jgi:hypothetical protein
VIKFIYYVVFHNTLYLSPGLPDEHFVYGLETFATSKNRLSF